MTFILNYHRYHVRYRDPFDTLDEAVRFAAFAEDNGQMYANHVEDEAGEIVLDGNALRQQMHAVQDAYDASIRALASKDTLRHSEDA